MSTSNVIKVRHLGLAAYVHMKGMPLRGCEGKNFLFESDRSVESWRAEYMNTDCMRHDSLVCELRQFIKGP